VPFLAISCLLIKWLYDVTSDICTPNSYKPSLSSYNESPSSISNEFWGSIVKTILLHYRWFLIGKNSSFFERYFGYNNVLFFWDTYKLCKRTSPSTSGVLKSLLNVPVIDPLGRLSS
jgi:hypothetical protein